MKLQTHPTYQNEFKISPLMTAGNALQSVRGRVLPPLLMYLFGVPGFICLLAWLFFFRGH